jgi:GH15 family glucan-1,4-alpha-glucosidase
MIRAQNETLQALLSEAYDPPRLRQIRQVLETHGTLTMRPLASGLFSASPLTDFSRGTNYHAAWTRDNVHVAYAHFANGRPEVAANTAKALAAFYQTQRPRIQAIIRDPAIKQTPMQRPHVRFDGDTCRELPQDWSHAQNDALGYFVWLSVTLALRGATRVDDLDFELLADFVGYFRAIEYWTDEDSGHWEEAVKVSASSIGAVVAGLRQICELCRLAAEFEQRQVERRQVAGVISEAARRRITETLANSGVDELTKRGEQALSRILPAECVQDDPQKARPYDAALVFLIYPLAVVDDELADQIVDRTVQQLRGPLGIKRYLGDSFYCSDYESVMAQRRDDPTRNFSRDMASRNKLLQAGEEAQWCIFDSILSVHFGQRYRQTKSAAALEKQTEHLNRALAQITHADPPRCEAFQCPELYYHEQGRLQTSKSTPLLWAQANLWTALEAMERSLTS